MTSQVNSFIEYLIPAYNILVLPLQLHFIKNLALF